MTSLLLSSNGKTIEVDARHKTITGDFWVCEKWGKTITKYTASIFFFGKKLCWGLIPPQVYKLGDPLYYY